MFMSVDLPEPLAPISATNSRCWISRETPRTACTGIKSGNATILRGGSEAIECNRQLAALIGEGLAAAGLPREAVQLVDYNRSCAVGLLVSNPLYVDIIVRAADAR